MRERGHWCIIALQSVGFRIDLEIATARNAGVAQTKAVRDWQRLSDEELLRLRVKDLGLQIAGSPLDAMVQRLYAELHARGICFRPPCYLADEWLCPDKEPIIGIPFCLANQRLKRLERKMMYEVEGGTEQACMKLLRHECGHAINYAYRLYTRTRWRDLFGLFSTPYTDTYDYQPYSRRYVVHLADHYAQAHPDEDFAETFAVWLTPNSNWASKYRTWPAMKKLQYVDRVMERIATARPEVTSSLRPPWAASRMTSTLESYYQRRRRGLGRDFQGYYDDPLRQIFVRDEHANGYMSAAEFLRTHRRAIIDPVARWTGHRKYDLHQLLGRLISRCDTLRLHTRPDTRGLLDVATLLATIAAGTHRAGDKR